MKSYHYVKKLGMQEYIIMDDMMNLVAKFSNEFEETKKIAKEQIKVFWKENPDHPHRTMLLENTMTNINLSNYSKDMLRTIFFDVKSSANPSEIENIRNEITNQAEESALNYATFLQAINSMDLVMKCYPDGIRVTCHPKPGQLGLNLVSQRSFNFPWNGVGVLKKNGEIKVLLEDEAKRDKKYVAVHIRGEEFPFYYEEE